MAACQRLHLNETARRRGATWASAARPSAVGTAAPGNGTPGNGTTGAVARWRRCLGLSRYPRLRRAAGILLRAGLVLAVLASWAAIASATHGPGPAAPAWDAETAWGAETAASDGAAADSPGDEAPAVAGEVGHIVSEVLSLQRATTGVAMFARMRTGPLAGGASPGDVMARWPGTRGLAWLDPGRVFAAATALAADNRVFLAMMAVPVVMFVMFGL